MSRAAVGFGVMGCLFRLRLRLAVKRMSTTRDLLLPKLISGQLDVEDLDIDVSMTAEELTEAAAG